MATAPREMPRRREMTEVKAPDQFQFTRVNETLSGILIDIDQVGLKDKKTGETKPTMQYTLMGDDGQRRTCLATWDMQKKIQPSHIGHWMTITYEGEDNTIETQGSKIKKFKVQVSKEKEPGF